MEIVNLKTRELFILADIGRREDLGEISDGMVATALSRLGPGPITVRLNSYGGGVDTGLMIYSLLRQHNGTVTIDVGGGIAASIASLILLAGDVRTAERSASVMIHDPWGVAVGTAEDFEATAKTLRHYRERTIGVYVERTLMKRSEIEKAMAAETYYSAGDALEHGFLTAVVGVDSTGRFPKRDAAAAKIAQRQAKAKISELKSRQVSRAEQEYVSGKVAKSKGGGSVRYPNPFPLRTAAALQLLERRLTARRKT